MSAFYVFLGGGLGSLCRYGLALVLPASPRFPWGTFAANAMSCLVLGSLIGLLSRQLPVADYRLLLVTGFCGGFSTFSTLVNELFQLLREGQWPAAVLYLSASLLVGLAAIYLGLKASGDWPTGN